jgi:hypothetical protein
MGSAGIDRGAFNWARLEADIILPAQEVISPGKGAQDRGKWVSRFIIDERQISSSYL